MVGLRGHDRIEILEVECGSGPKTTLESCCQQSTADEVTDRRETHAEPIRDFATVVKAQAPGGDNVCREAGMFAQMLLHRLGTITVKHPFAEFVDDLSG